ncbi:MAG: hypothetical protein HGA49_04305 [Eubacteriaceae bacterium]|nr:hypothetical protein [Eubacteriaceae bacterium]
MSTYNVMTVLVNQRTTEAKLLQEALTKYGCIIKVRLGLHEVGDRCSEEGLIILQLAEDDAQVDELKCALNSLEGVVAKNTRITSGEE